jgi:hypothetical protein
MKSKRSIRDNRRLRHRNVQLAEYLLIFHIPMYLDKVFMFSEPLYKRCLPTSATF